MTSHYRKLTNLEFIKKNIIDIFNNTFSPLKDSFEYYHQAGINTYFIQKELLEDTTVNKIFELNYEKTKASMLKFKEKNNFQRINTLDINKKFLEFVREELDLEYINTLYYNKIFDKSKESVGAVVSQILETKKITPYILAEKIQCQFCGELYNICINKKSDVLNVKKIKNHCNNCKNIIINLNLNESYDYEDEYGGKIISFNSYKFESKETGNSTFEIRKKNIYNKEFPIDIERIKVTDLKIIECYSQFKKLLLNFLEQNIKFEEYECIWDKEKQYNKWYSQKDKKVYDKEVINFLTYISKHPKIKQIDILDLIHDYIRCNYNIYNTEFEYNNLLSFLDNYGVIKIFYSDIVDVECLVDEIITNSILINSEKINDFNFDLKKLDLELNYISFIDIDFHNLDFCKKVLDGIILNDYFLNYPLDGFEIEKKIEVDKKSSSIYRFEENHNSLFNSPAEKEYYFELIKKYPEHIIQVNYPANKVFNFYKMPNIYSRLFKQDEQSYLYKCIFDFVIYDENGKLIIIYELQKGKHHFNGEYNEKDILKRRFLDMMDVDFKEKF